MKHVLIWCVDGDYVVYGWGPSYSNWLIPGTQIED